MNEISIFLAFLLSSEKCQFVAEKALESWNDYESKRRYTRTKLLIDIPDDYEPAVQKRQHVQKRKTASNKCSEVQRKKQKVKAIKCELLNSFSFLFPFSLFRCKPMRQSYLIRRSRAS